MENEKRLIDANALVDDTYVLNSWDAEIVRAWVADQPTVDAVEVVRCKDCKYWQESVDGVSKWCPLLMDKETKADDFCSYGERREGE